MNRRLLWTLGVASVVWLAVALVTAVCVGQQPPQAGHAPIYRIHYPTPLRDWLFGKYLVPYRMVTPPPRQIWYQPPPYLVPITSMHIDPSENPGTSKGVPR